jgi:LAO/AO transport system kinase
VTVPVTNPTPRDLRTAPAATVAAMRAGDRRALATAVTDLERLSAAAPALVRAMQPHLGRAVVVGVTGPPGAGKSTLVNALVGHWRARDARVAVVAVDPSSPISGGAILGDRIRMTAALDDTGVYVRSLSSGGHLGGLSPAAVRIVDVLDAAGFGTVLLETVGAGQNEVDVAEVADVRVVVAAPGLGDDIQAMKSGLLEIADVLVVNKGDREGAERTLHQLQAALAIRTATASRVPALKTTATTGEGIPALVEAISAAGARAHRASAADRRRRRARYLIARAAADLVAERIRAGGAVDIDTMADAVLAGDLDPRSAARRLISG